MFSLQLLLNIYLASHITSLYSLIRESAIIQYFETYLTSQINQMALEFRTTAELVSGGHLVESGLFNDRKCCPFLQLEAELIGLIEKGKLRAKIDSYNKILHAKFSDNRTEIYDR